MKTSADSSMRCLLIVFFCLPLIGCGSSVREKAELYPVTGKVTVNGEPAEGVRVTLRPKDGKPVDEYNARPTGMSDASGMLAFMTYEPGDGVPAGEYIFTLDWPNMPPGGPITPKDRLKGKFNQVGAFDRTITVDGSGPVEFDPIEIDFKNPLPAVDLDAMKKRMMEAAKK